MPEKKLDQSFVTSLEELNQSKGQKPLGSKKCNPYLPWDDTEVYLFLAIVFLNGASSLAPKIVRKVIFVLPKKKT